MKLADIRPGGKYYKSSGEGDRRRGGKKTPTVVAVRVLEVNTVEQKVLASIGGFPAVWYGGGSYYRWSAENKKEGV